MCGSDSAPHPREAKECPGCAAGVFTAPIALQVLAELFESNGASPEQLQAFISGNAQKIYHLEPESKEVVLTKEPFSIPENYEGVVPFYSGTTIDYTVHTVI
jgi:dihydroorotase